MVRGGAGVVSPVEVHIKVHKAKRDLWGMCHAALTQHYALTNVRCIFSTRALECCKCHTDTRAL